MNFPDRITPFSAPSLPSGGLPAALLDRVPIGLVLLAADGGLVGSNAAARRSIDGGTAGLRRDGERLGPADETQALVWRRALAEVTRGEATMLRLHGRPGGTPITLSPWCGEPGPARIVCALPACDRSETAALHLYARTHGMSAGESAILVALARGASPKEIALRRGSAEATVRSQVKAMLSKTGRHGLRELVVDALRSASLPLSDPAHRGR